MQTKVMEVGQIVSLENSKKARQICSDSIDLDAVRNNPAFIALSELEQEIYLIHLNGRSNNYICERFELKPYQVTRIIQGIKAKLNYLYHFRNVLERFPGWRKKFYSIKEELPHDTDNN